MIKILFLGFIYISVLIAQINTESMRKETAVEGFESTLGFEFGFEKSDREVMDITGEYRVDHFLTGGLHSFLVINYDNGYEKEPSGKNTIVNKGFGHFRMTKNISSNLYIEFFSQFGFNDFLLMKNRKLYGSGLRYKVIVNDRLNAFIGIGGMKENEKYSLKTENFKSLLRSTNYFTWNINLSKNATLNNTVYYQLDTSMPKDHRVLYDGDLDVELNEKFTFTFTLNYRYDNDPHGTLGKNYIQVSNGFKFNF